MFGLLWVFVIWSFKCIYCSYQLLACLKPNKLVCKSKSSFFVDYVGKIMAWCLMCLVCSPFMNWMKLRNLYLVYINECGGIDVYYHMSLSTSFIFFFLVMAMYFLVGQTIWTHLGWYTFLVVMNDAWLVWISIFLHFLFFRVNPNQLNYVFYNIYIFSRKYYEL